MAFPEEKVNTPPQRHFENDAPQMCRDAHTHVYTQTAPWAPLWKPVVQGGKTVEGAQ